MKKIIKRWFGYYGLLIRIQGVEQEIKHLKWELEKNECSCKKDIKLTPVCPSDMYDDITYLNGL